MTGKKALKTHVLAPVQCMKFTNNHVYIYCFKILLGQGNKICVFSTNSLDKKYTCKVSSYMQARLLTYIFITIFLSHDVMSFTIQDKVLTFNSACSLCLKKNFTYMYLPESQISFLFKKKNIVTMTMCSNLEE